MIISQCRASDCSDFATNAAHLCTKHMQEHVKRCQMLVKGGKNTNGAEDALKGDIRDLLDKYESNMREALSRE